MHIAKVHIPLLNGALNTILETHNLIEFCRQANLVFSPIEKGLIQSSLVREMNTSPIIIALI